MEDAVGNKVIISHVSGGAVSYNNDNIVSDGYGIFKSKEQIIQDSKRSRSSVVPQRSSVVPQPRRKMTPGGTEKWSGDHIVEDPAWAGIPDGPLISYADTMLHLFRGNIGTGLLAMGDAFRNGGLMFAPIATAILGIICVHAQHLLLNGSDMMHKIVKDRRPPGYADTVYYVFKYGPPRYQKMAGTMKIMVNTFLCITQLGFCCVYIVFIATNVKMICDQYNIHIDISIHMIFVVIPVLLACMVRNLKYLTPFSTIANIMMAVGVAVVIYYCTQVRLEVIKDRALIGSYDQIPLYFGTAIYAFEGIGLVLPLKTEMQKPSQFQKPFGVLNVGMVVVGSIFITVGFLGYVKYGEDVEGSLTLNLPPGLLSNAVQILIALSILFTYPLQFYVPVVITMPWIYKKFGTRKAVIKEITYRIFLVMLTFVLAESIPELGLFITLVGAVSSTALALMFPPIIELVSRLQKPKTSLIITIIIWIKNVIIILLGVFIFITGTYESLASLFKAFNK